MRPSPRARILLNLAAFVVAGVLMLQNGAPIWALWLLGYIYLCVVE
jgi:hypothetical protein